MTLWTLASKSMPERDSYCDTRARAARPASIDYGNWQEGLANAKVGLIAQQQWVYEGPQWRNVQQISATNIMLKSTFSGLQRCRWQYGSIFIRLAVTRFQICEISRNSSQIRRPTYSTSRSSNVIDLGANRNRIRPIGYNFLYQFLLYLSYTLTVFVYACNYSVRTACVANNLINYH